MIVKYGSDLDTLVEKKKEYNKNIDELKIKLNNYENYSNNIQKEIEDLHQNIDPITQKYIENLQDKQKAIRKVKDDYSEIFDEHAKIKKEYQEKLRIEKYGMATLSKNVSKLKRQVWTNKDKDIIQSRNDLLVAMKLTKD